MTPHNKAKIGDIAECVLMPGDPLRAKYIAQNFLRDVVCYNDVRNMLGFTGIYGKKKVSVQSSGMGIPSVTIYAHELFQIYGCKTIIRVGTCGGLADNVEIGDIVFAMGACTDSGMNRAVFGSNDYAAIADFDTLRAAIDLIKDCQKSTHVGLVLTTDRFYDDNQDTNLWANYGVLAVDMETSALYTLAAKFRCRSLSLLKVTDHIVKKSNAMSCEQREKGLDDTIKIALDTLSQISSQL